MGRRWPDWLLASGLLALTGEFVFLLFWRATLVIARNRSEGWNAYHAQAAFDGAALYHPAGALLANNYPPLSFLLTAAVMHLGPDGVFAGRLIAALAFVACATLIGALVHAQTGDAVASLVAATAFACWMAVHQPEWVGIDDPQLLGHALLLGGLLLLARGNGLVAPMLAALLCVAGLFAKHNLLALPLAAFAWQLRVRPGRAALFALAGAALAVLGFLECWLAYGSDLLDGMLAPRVTSAARAWRLLLLGAAGLAPLLCLGAFAATERDARRFSWFVGLYLMLGAALGVVQFAGEGVNGHAIDDAVIAASLGAGLLVARAGRRWVAIAATAAAVLLAGPDLSDVKDMLQPGAWMAQQRARSLATRQMVALVASRPGAAICDTAVYCYWAGKPQLVDSFHLDQLLALRLSDGADLLAAVQDGDVGAITLLPGPPDALATILADALRHDYHVALAQPEQQVAYVKAP
jgi:hypothetical protein